jgi:hypothetical protein
VSARPSGSAFLRDFVSMKYAILRVSGSTLSPRFFIVPPSRLQTAATPGSLYGSVVWKPDDLPDRPKPSSGAKLLHK